MVIAHVQLVSMVTSVGNNAKLVSMVKIANISMSIKRTIKLKALLFRSFINFNFSRMNNFPCLVMNSFLCKKGKL